MEARTLEMQIIHQLEREPGISAKVLAQRVTGKTMERVGAINRMIQDGVIVVGGITLEYVPVLFMGRLREATPITPAAFHNAYLAIGKGNRCVRIHRLREHLGWERQAFDALLLKLMADEQLILQRGDPTQLTTAEVKNSYEDANGMLYVTMSWIGSTP